MNGAAPFPSMKDSVNQNLNLNLLSLFFYSIKSIPAAPVDRFTQRATAEVGRMCAGLL